MGTSDFYLISYESYEYDDPEWDTGMWTPQLKVIGPVTIKELSKKCDEMGRKGTIRNVRSFELALAYGDTEDDDS